MRILVIGGTRFIGPRVVKALVSDSNSVTVLHRGSTVTDLPAQVKTLRADRRFLTSMSRQLRSLEPDVVLDMFCLTEQDAQGLDRKSVV